MYRHLFRNIMFEKSFILLSIYLENKEKIQYRILIQNLQFIKFNNILLKSRERNLKLKLYLSLLLDEIALKIRIV